MSEGIMVTLYSMLVSLANRRNQVIGERNDYYVTLWQVERVIKDILADERHKQLCNAEAETK